MNKYIDRFPEQLLEAVKIGNNLTKIECPRPIHNIVISGMGGSGIGGLLVKDLLKATITLPIEVVNDYNLPASCNQNTFLICSSYSGNTEETLAAFNQAVERNCMIACITSGGKLAELARQHNFPVVIIPGGMPPRSCLGFSFVAQLFVLHKAGIISETFIAETQSAAMLLTASKEALQQTAKSIASIVKNTIPIIYADVAIHATAIRLKQQINENAKMLSFSHVLPEMNHNELVAYYAKHEQLSVIYLRHQDEHPQTQKRFGLVEELIQDKIGCSASIFAEGNSFLENIFYLIHVGDWLSFYLAELEQVDPIKIEMLDWLKIALEKK
jgi:glucose/mannose-6-phosphate isomerase